MTLPNSGTPETSFSSIPSRPRDWIEVDRMLRRLVDAAPDEQERSALLLATDVCGGPDPEIMGGGEVWVEALNDARNQIVQQTASDLDRDPDATHIDVDDLVEKLDQGRDVTLVLEEAVARGRAAERRAVAGWLTARSRRMRQNGARNDVAEGLALAAKRITEAAFHSS